MTIVAFLELDIQKFHGWAVMVVTAMMAGYGKAMIGITAMLVFTWKSSIFVFIYKSLHGQAVTVDIAVIILAEIHKRVHG